MEAISLLLILLSVVSCILIPIWLKHRLYYKQLDAITAAIEKGVDPAEIKRSLAIQPRSGDINGNWKAGVLLIWLGSSMFVLAMIASILGGTYEWGALLLLTPAVIGITLLVIHDRIVGKVVRIGESASHGEPGSHSHE